MKEIRPYFIVPKLIPQPTWGGKYIAEYKGIQIVQIQEQNIGQSYELSSDTLLSTVSDLSQLPIEIADPATGKTIEMIGDPTSCFPLQELIDQDPDAVLGENYVKQYGPRMQILIKFTQAKGNSFQVHLRQGNKLGHWLPKPESWYFLEDGKATLGLKNPTPERTKEYKDVCLAIDAYMQEIALRLQRGEVSFLQAKAEITAFLKTQDPFAFVNAMPIPKGAVVDLSAGGIHHSWEEGEEIPLGNIVYEVQQNVMDADCTLRSFDKGKITEEGALRPVHIEDYFSALDTDPAKNIPSTLIQQSINETLFETPYYTTKLNHDQGSLDTSFGNQSFVHRFFIHDGVQKKGISLFIPAVAEK